MNEAEELGYHGKFPEGRERKIRKLKTDFCPSLAFLRFSI
jgi:hypothetical protein